MRIFGCGQRTRRPDEFRKEKTVTLHHFYPMRVNQTKPEPVTWYQVHNSSTSDCGLPGEHIYLSARDGCDSHAFVSQIRWSSRSPNPGAPQMKGGTHLTHGRFERGSCLLRSNQEKQRKPSARNTAGRGKKALGVEGRHTHSSWWMSSL